MKILFISNIASSRIGNFSIPSIYAAEKLGMEFHFAANWNKVNKDIIEEEKEKYGINIHNIDFERNPFSLQNYRSYRQLIKLMKENKFDIVHCNTPIGGILGRICAKKAKIQKVIYTAHGFHFYKGAPKFNNIVYKSVEKLLARITDVIITINKEDYEAAKTFRLRKNGKIYYVPGVGVDVDEYREVEVNRNKKREDVGVPVGCDLIIMVGELIKRKNYESAIKAISEVDKNVHCIICGTGTEEEYLKSLCFKLGVEDRIHFLGFRKDIVELLKCSDIFLFTTYQEGLARALMEAMACGVIPIVSDIRGNVDLVQDGFNGYLFNPYDYKDIAKSIKNILKNEEILNIMSKNNQKIIDGFSVDNVKMQMKDIYTNII